MGPAHFTIGVATVVPGPESSPPPNVPSAPPSTSGTLRWLNGDMMAGNLVGATGTTASWQSPLFLEPVVVSWDALHRADWPAATTAVSGSDPFIFTLRDGSALLGDIVSVSGSAVDISGSRIGEIEIPRSQLLSARRLNGGDLVFGGPAGDAGWKGIVPDGLPDTGTPAAPPMVVADGGALVLPYWNRSALLNVKLPDAMDIEFHIHSSDVPSFRLILGEKAGATMAIQTWGNEIVVTTGQQFKYVRTLADDERDVALRFCWDRVTRHCEVFTPDGKLLVDWMPSGADNTGAGGLQIQNKGVDLALTLLRIRKWNDAPPPTVDLTQPRIELADGSIVNGTIAETGSDGSLELSATAAAAQARNTPIAGGSAQISGSAAGIALKDVEAIVFSPDTSGTAQAIETLTYSDGAFLKGRILAVAQGVATIETAFSPNPIPMRMDGLRQLLILTPKDDKIPARATAPDTLRVGDHLLHGTLVGGDGANPQWLPAGGGAPVTPPPASSYEIARTLPDNLQPAAAPALFYTRMGDVLPGNMHAIDRDGVEFDSTITQATRLPASAIEAIQFGTGAAGKIEGFSDPAWCLLKGGEQSIQRDGNSIEMQPGSSMGNSAAMQSSVIRFHMKVGSGLSAARLRLFCDAMDPAKSHNILFASNGAMLMVGGESTEGQFDTRVDAQAPGGDIDIRLEIEDESVNVYLNGVSALKLPIASADRAGSGLIIEPAGVWGNAGQSITLGDFSLSSRPGATWLPEVAPDAKAQALSIPRFRRDDPPRHALIATNGDVLRGEIEGATTQNFAFRSGMEELVVPRDRVKAVIWLPKPIDAQPAPPPSHSVDSILDQTMNMMITFGGASLQSVTSWLQATYPGLKFQFPPSPKPTKKGRQLTRRVPMVRLGGGTVRETLDRVCALFGMQYSVNDKGVVVFTPNGSSNGPAQLVDKVYWLKPGSLPVDAPADKTLAAKGIAFPTGATAEWQADQGLLSMHNSQDNQVLLAKLLATDFGGAIGSPTHWLVLTSGARLGLAVDKFGKDTITGWHPLYGHCTIPTQDVALVRTSPLQQSAAMKSLQGWRPYYAPEPVLPTEGGDTDASIGKLASEFNLKLLGGGKFDLAGNKGKIVVLDFWATWCGPCVRSLPGLIDSMAGFPPDRVTFIGVNEDEPSTTVQEFLETRSLKLTVALDDGGAVGQKYGADSIPHTVIIGPDGKIAWVKTGYTPDGEGDAAKEVTQLLNPTPAGH